jgi:hypothetical protein
MLISRRSALQAIIHELLQSRDGVCYPRPGHPTSRYEERASLLISFSSVSLQLSGRDGTGWNHRSYYKLRSLFEVFKAPTTLTTPHSDPLVDPFCAEYSSLKNAALKSDFVNLPELCSYTRKCADVCSPPLRCRPLFAGSAAAPQRSLPCQVVGSAVLLNSHSTILLLQPR